MSLVFNCDSFSEFKSRKLTLLFCSLISFTAPCFSQQTFPLYPGKIPNSLPVKDIEHADKNGFTFEISQPTLSVFLPPAGTGNGTAVILCPGGGYSGVNMDMEGYAVAKQLNKLGVAAFVLKYRLPADVRMPDKSIGPLQDAQQAIKTVRMKATEWGVNPGRVGIMGFSAGGHLASTAGTHFDKSFIPNPENTNLRPDFMILVYPVISFNDTIAHIGSRDNLIGKNAGNDKVKFWSSELQVTAKTPPAFIIQAGDDGLVPVQNSIVFYQAMQKHHIPCGLHIFPTGQHGFPLEPAHSTWFDYCASWLKENSWLAK